MKKRVHPYKQIRTEKDVLFTKELLDLTEYHRQHCEAYEKMLQAVAYQKSSIRHYSDLPFLPVTLFKKMRLSSIEEENIKVVTSSGTGGQKKSQIVLDADTRIMQQRALAAIGGSFLGVKRMPMLVIDCPSVVMQRNSFSARTAGIQGFSLFGTHRTFALREDMTLDLRVVSDFLEKYGSQRFLIFGFTFLIWQYFCMELERQGIVLDCSNGILIHGGGWKRLIARAVSEEAFHERLQKVCGLSRIHDYYGMAEQAGSIFMECECGHLHCSDYSAVLFRRSEDFSLCEEGEPGLIQVMSLIPRSYPGHNLLTEDVGRLLGVDDCPCGRAGVYFEVIGRAEHAELRGCSDTYASE